MTLHDCRFPPEGPCRLGRIKGWVREMLEHGTELFEVSPVGVNGVGLWFDSDRLMLEGVYLDEVSAYRARRRWIEALEANFLLEERVDFVMKVRRTQNAGHYSVRCGFLTACGRYAFWRLTHHQAPEVQFLLETAHLAHSEAEPFAVEKDEECEALDPGRSAQLIAEQLYGVQKKGKLVRAAALVRAMARRIFSRGGSDSNFH